MNIMENEFLRDMRNRQEAEANYFAEVQKFALKQELVLVKIFPRRFMIIKLNNVSNVKLINDTYLRGDVVFGPETLESCHNYIGENTNKLPGDLLPQ